MSKIIVVGDVHGDLNQLMYPLIHFLKNRREYRKIIYLGDYIDRGESNVYIYEIIRWIMKDVKDKDIIFLRGNHESYDSAVYDYIYPNSSNEKFIKTFIFNGFAKLKMDIVYYDELTNILFSHSPLSRDLNECLAMNDTKTNMAANSINTYTNDKENKTMTYRNIHGHEHHMSNKETIDAFFKGYRKMICLDDDASYGIQLVKQYPIRSKLSSHVKFMEFSNNSYKIITNVISFKSNDDFNTKQFSIIKKVLFSLIKVGDKLKSDLNFKSSKQILLSTIGKNNIISIKLIKEININNKEKTKGIMTYYHDIPAELWKEFNIIMNGYPDCIYHTIITNHNNNKASSLLGGMLTNKWLFIQFIVNKFLFKVVVITIIVVITVYLIVIKIHSYRNVQHIQ